MSLFGEIQRSRVAFVLNFWVLYVSLRIVHNNSIYKIIYYCKFSCFYCIFSNCWSTFLGQFLLHFWNCYFGLDGGWILFCFLGLVRNMIFLGDLSRLPSSSYIIPAQFKPCWISSLQKMDEWKIQRLTQETVLEDQENPVR